MKGHLPPLSLDSLLLPAPRKNWLNCRKFLQPGQSKHQNMVSKPKAAKEPELGETVGLPKILSPPAEPKLPKVSKAPVVTPKRRRMASVLDAVLESTRASTPAPAKETAEDATVRVETEVGPTEAEPAGTGQRN